MTLLSQVYFGEDLEKIVEQQVPYNMMPYVSENYSVELEGLPFTIYPMTPEGEQLRQEDIKGLHCHEFTVEYEGEIYTVLVEHYD